MQLAPSLHRLGNGLINTYLVEESGLAYSRLARNNYKLAFTADRGVESLLQLSLFLLSADERRERNTG